MFVIGSLALLTSSLLVAGLSIRYLRRGCYMQLSLMALSFVVLDSLGLMLLPFTGLSLSYLENIIVPVLDPVEGESVYTVQLIAHLLTQGAFLLALLALPQLRRCRFSSGAYAFGWRLTQVGWLAIVFALAFSAFFYAKYFLYGPGLDLLLNFQLRFGSTTEAVTARSLAAQQVNYGQGAFGASIAAYVFLPFTAVALALILKSPVLSYASTITLGAMSLAYMLQIYQKAPVAFSLITYLAILLVPRLKRVNWFSSSRWKLQRKPIVIAVVLAVFSTLVGVGLYVVNFGLSYGQALEAFWGRILMVPPNTEGYWFLVYPGLHDFLGLANVLTTSMDVIQLTAYLAIGDVFSANASFLAVGWSGWGYVGILLNLLVLLLTVVMLDIWLARKTLMLRIIAAFLSFPALFFLVSGTIFDFFFKGGMIPMLLAVSFAEDIARSSSHPHCGNNAFGEDAGCAPFREA